VLFDAILGNVANTEDATLLKEWYTLNPCSEQYLMNDPRSKFGKYASDAKYGHPTPAARLRRGKEMPAWQAVNPGKEETLLRTRVGPRKMASADRDPSLTGWRVVW
jgi:hypothetical protein